MAPPSSLAWFPVNVEPVIVAVPDPPKSPIAKAPPA